MAYFIGDHNAPWSSSEQRLRLSYSNILFNNLSRKTQAVCAVWLQRIKATTLIFASNSQSNSSKILIRESYSYSDKLNRINRNVIRMRKQNRRSPMLQIVCREVEGKRKKI